jgi:Transposase DDE domain
MSGGRVFRSLLSFLSQAIDGFNDVRRGKNLQYSMQDIARSAFAVFFVQSPSFLAHQKLMQQARGMNNGRTLFGIQKLPTDNQIRNLLDAVDPKQLRPVFVSVFEYLQQLGLIDSFRSFANTLLIALDGTGYFYSESIHCPSCTVAQHRDGRLSYTHSAVMPAIVKPGCAQVIPLEPEFIVPQDGHDKQDCESVAAKRWLSAVGSRYTGLGITLVGDAIFGTQGYIEQLGQQDIQYIFVAKPGSHKYLYEELHSFEQLGQLRVIERTRWTGKQRLSYTYRYFNGVGLKDGEQALKVNWVELSITNPQGKIQLRVSFITSYLIDDANVEPLVEAGRCRWKIENEDFNTLKTKGYHFEHNFGHGKRFLSQTLLSLNILAFLFHTVLELADLRCALLRKTLPRRDTFFQHIAALTQYLCFASWASLLEFMIRGLQEGPGPPPDPLAIIR